MGKIVVLADDLSGAAELAGIACTLGLTAEVQRRFEPASEAAVIAVDSDTRGLPEHVAVEHVGELARQIAASRPAWIYMKVDSILRGHPRAEIEAVLAATGQTRAILIPANPSRGRIIAGGCYLVGGVPLNETSLANDPEYPRHSANVTLLLGPGPLRVHQITSSAPLPPAGIVVPNVSELAQVQRRASEVDSTTLPAGAADFFSAIIQFRRSPIPLSSSLNVETVVRLPALLVCGSPTALLVRTDECKAAGLAIVTMTDDLWNAVKHLENAGAAMLTIGGQPLTVSRLLADLADRAALILQRTQVSTLLIEGGATAAAVASRFGWSRFAVCAPGPAGVGILQPICDSPAPRVLIKPGSYAWPSEIWEPLCRPSSQPSSRLAK